MNNMNNFILTTINKYKYKLGFLLFIIVLVIVLYYFEGGIKSTVHHDKEPFVITTQNQFIFNKVIDKYVSYKKNSDMYYDLDKFSDTIPIQVDLRNKCPDVYNQERLGICHINAMAFLYHYITHNLKKDFIPSRLFAEYNISYSQGQMYKISNMYQFIANNIYYYGGASFIRDIYSTFIYGFCDERNYPYPDIKTQMKYINNIKDIKNIENDLTNNLEDKLTNITKKFNEIKVIPPTKKLYHEAKKHRILDIYNISNNVNHIKKYLHYNGPIAFAITNSDIIVNLDENKKNKKFCELILDNEKLSITDKKLLNESIHNLSVNIKIDSQSKWNFDSRYNITYNDIYKKIKSNKTLNLLMDKYSKEYLYKPLDLNTTKEDYVLTWPHDLINKCNKKLKEIGIDVVEYNKIMEYLLDYELQQYKDQYMNNRGLDDATIKRVLNNPELKDYNNFIKLFIHSSGHSMSIVGYDDTNKYFIVRNSWGKLWGDKGHCYIDYEYFSNTDHFWGFKINQLYTVHNTTDGSLDDFK